MRLFISRAMQELINIDKFSTV